METNVHVTVEKRLEFEAHRLPSVVFTVTTDASDPIWVRLRDRIPDDAETVGIGFHPDYGHERWQLRDGEVVYEDAVWEGTAVETLYGVATRDRTVLRSFMDEPTVEVAPADLLTEPESEDWSRLDDYQVTVETAEAAVADGGEPG